MWSFDAFGVRFKSGFPVAGASLRPFTPRGPEPVVRLRLASRGEVLDGWCGSTQTYERTAVDGRPFTIARGTAGDVLYTLEREAVFHLSADADELTVAPYAVRDLTWQRALMDSILASISYRRGHEILHASAVGGARGAVGFIAEGGGGKSTLARELLTEGWNLVCDDVLALRRDPDGVVACPGPPLMTINSVDAAVAAACGAGEVLCEIEDEAWMTVHQAATHPLPISALVLLRRRHGLASRCLRLEPTPLDLIPHMHDGQATGHRMRRRFELVNELLSQAPLFRLEADLDVPPRELVAIAAEARAVAENVDATG